MDETGKLSSELQSIQVFEKNKADFFIDEKKKKKLQIGNYRQINLYSKLSPQLSTEIKRMETFGFSYRIYGPGRVKEN